MCPLSNVWFESHTKSTIAVISKFRFQVNMIEYECVRVCCRFVFTLHHIS